MSVISSEKRTELLARKEAYEASLDIALDTLDNLLAAQNEQYKFDSGEGAQSAVKRSLTEQFKAIEWLESRIAHIEQRLNGTGVVKINVRRKLGSITRKYGIRPN